MSNSSKPTPAVRLNFFFNTLIPHAEGARKVPVSNHGLIVPWGPNQAGIPAWRSDWLVLDPEPPEPESPYWLPGKRILQVNASKPSTQYLPVAGNQFVIFIYENPPRDGKEPEIPVEYNIPIVTTYQPAGGTERYVQPGSVFADIPKSGNVPSMCCTYSGKKKIACPAPPDPFDETNMFLKLTFLDPTINGYAEGVVRVYTAVYLFVPDGKYEKYFFDDPEMEVNLP